MRFMMIYTPADRKSMEAGAPPTEREMAEMGKFIEETAKSGVLQATDGLLPSSRGALVRQDRGKVTVTDGPFSEAKEIIGGFAIVKCRSKAEAVELSRRFLKIAGDGETEIREMYGEPAFPPSK